MLLSNGVRRGKGGENAVMLKKKKNLLV